MAGKGAVALDKVVINIESNIGNTPKSVARLAKSLETLKKSVTGGFNNIHKLSVALGELNKVSKKLPDTAKNLKSLSKVGSALSSLNSIQKPAGLVSTMNALSKIPKVFKDINPKSLENVARVSAELAAALSPVADKLQKIGNGFSALSSLAKTYGVQITRVGDSTKETANKLTAAYTGLKTMGKALKGVGSVGVATVKGLNKVFDKMGSKIKQIGLSLLGTRTIFTLTRKAVSEYMQMDEQLTKATQNLWRALGAQLAPAIEGVLYLFKQVVRVIYSVVYALTGIDLIARANAKAMQAMGSAAGDALGNLQKFDDLNVVTFDKGGKDFEKIELEKIDLTPIQKVIDWMKKLKTEIETAWNTGQWNGVAKVLGEGINGVVDYINPTAIATALGNAIIGGLQFVRTFVSTIDWGELGKKIRETIENIPWKDIWDEVVKLAKESFKGFDDFMDELFNSNAGGEWAAGLLLSFKVLDKVDSKSITNFFTNILKYGDESIGKLGNVGQAFTLLGKNTLTTDTISGITGVSTGLTNMLAPLADVSAKIGALFGGGALGGAIAIIGAIVVLVIGLVQAFKNLYNNNDEFRKSFDELIAGIKDVGLKIFEELKEAVSKVIEVVTHIWQKVLVPLFNLFVSILEPFLKALVEILNVLWKTVIAPLASFLMDVFSIAIDVVVWAFELLIAILNPVIKIFQWLWDKILDPIVTFLLDIFVAAIQALGDEFKHTVAVIKSVLMGLWDIVKWIVNGIITLVEGFVNGIITGINFLIKGINKLSFDVPDWVPEIGGKTLGFNLKLIDKISLPRLEVGTNEIPYEGIYHLHPGEAVVPKKYNPALGGGTNEETNQKLDTLISIMENMNFTNVVNVGNETLYKRQQRYNAMQNDKYGTTVNL